MALPEKHIRHLRNDLEVHETRIAELRKQVTKLEEEIKAHDWIVRLGKDPRIMKKLDELGANPESIKNITGKELEIARREGIELPPNCCVNVTQDAGSVTVFLEAKHGENPYTLTWNSKAGFSSGPERRSF